MCAMLDLVRSRLNSVGSIPCFHKRRKNTKVSLLFCFCQASFNPWTRFTAHGIVFIHSPRVLVSSMQWLLAIISKLWVLYFFQKRFNLKTSLRKRHMLFMYLSSPTTTNFPAICGASYSTACACKQYNCWRCHEFKVYLPAVYKKLTDLQQMANLWFQSSSLC